ncbi:hypothetical protein Tco_0866675 [Tanacetum coccineum]
MSSLQHLTKDFNFGDQFFNDKPSEAENEKTTAKTKPESMVSITIHQDTSQPHNNNYNKNNHSSSTTSTTTKRHRLHIDKAHRLYKLENLDITHQVSKAVDEIITDVVDWAIQAPLRDHFRDLPEADMKEILHHRM